MLGSSLAESAILGRMSFVIRPRAWTWVSLGCMSQAALWRR